MTRRHRGRPLASLTRRVVLVPAHRVFKPDPEFWRVRRSRAEVHSITLRFQPTGFCADRNVHAALEKAYRSLDWAALKRLVDAQR